MRKTLVLLLLTVPLRANLRSEPLKILDAAASSVEHANPDLGAKQAVDGDPSTRWASEWSDPQWIRFDLGRPEEFNLLTIVWETAYGKEYEVQVSNDGKDWKNVFKQENGAGGKEGIPLQKQKARFIRIYGIRRGTEWGYSVHEFKVAMKRDSELPSAPAGLSVLTGHRALALSWDENPEADLLGYNVYRRTGESGNFVKLNSKIIRRPKTTDRSAADGVRHFYFVKAVDETGREGPASEAISGTPAPIGAKNSYLDPSFPIEERVEDLLSRMTLEEKVEQLSGIQKTLEGFDNFTTYANDRLGIPPIKTTDGPHGVRWGKATAWPVSIALAAAWEPELMRRIGVAMARECKAKGRNMLLGPGFNICRDPRAGRTHEGYGEDPFLVSRTAVAAVLGIQSEKVIACAKHLACNNIETGRGGGPVVVDERTLKEIYLPAFKACVREGGAWSVMCAYNKVNGFFCSENAHLLTDVLRKEWGFKGLVISDWGAVHSAAALKAGLDLEMPETNFFGGPLLNALRRGEVSQEAIDEGARRVLRVKFLAGLFEDQPKADPGVVECREHIALAREAAGKTIVLLKNDGGLLPLDRNKIKSIAVLGPNANLTTAGIGLGSSQGEPSYAVTPLEGIRGKVGDRIKITDRPETADAAIFFAGLAESIAGRIEGEGADRPHLHLSGDQDDQIRKALSQNKNTIVVLISGSAIAEDWMDRAPAILQAWYPGQEGGNAIADVLFGDVNPGAKLPITFPRSLDQLRPMEWNYEGEHETGVGYRYYEKQGLKPRFPFGHGLSYQRFEYGKLKIGPQDDAGGVRLSASVKNTGRRSGEEVVQLYLRGLKKGEKKPGKALRGFKRISLEPGESKEVEFLLTPADLASYDENMNFVLEPKKVEALVGASSEDIRLKGSFEVTKPIRNIP